MLIENVQEKIEMALFMAFTFLSACQCSPGSITQKSVSYMVSHWSHNMSFDHELDANLLSVQQPVPTSIHLLKSSSSAPQLCRKDIWLQFLHRASHDTPWSTSIRSSMWLQATQAIRSYCWVPVYWDGTEFVFKFHILNYSHEFF